MARVTLSRKRIGILLFLALLVWRAWPLVPIFSGLNTKVSTDQNLIADLLPPAKPPVLILEGLSHPYWEPGSLTKEIIIGRRSINHGHAFHPDEIETLTEHLELASILTKRSSYIRWGGIKMCGGFHGDYLITWRDGDRKWELILCTGCDEVILYHDGRAVKCDLARKTYSRINTLYSRIKKYPPRNPKDSFRRLLLSVDLINESNIVKEDPSLLLDELGTGGTVELIKLIKSHADDDTQIPPQVSELLKKQTLDCIVHLSKIERFPHSLISLITDPELNWTPSESLQLQDAIVSYGRRAIRVLKNAPQDNKILQQCLTIVSASKE